MKNIKVSTLNYVEFLVNEKGNHTIDVCNENIENLKDFIKLINIAKRNGFVVNVTSSIVATLNFHMKVATIPNTYRTKFSNGSLSNPLIGEYLAKINEYIIKYERRIEFLEKDIEVEDDELHLIFQNKEEN